MAQNLINETDPGETPEVEGKTEPADAPIEANSRSIKRWCLSKHEKVVPGLVIIKRWCLSKRKKVVPGLVIVKRWCLSKRGKVITGLVLVLLISFVVYGLKYWHMDPGGNDQKVTLTQVYRAPITRDSGAILDFAAFLVLLPGDDDRAYFSLSISVKLSNSNVYREIEEKKTFFRWVIYGVLNKTVKDSSSQIISKEQLKRDIIGALNGLLVTGAIDDIYFIRFLVV